MDILSSVTQNVVYLLLCFLTDCWLPASDSPCVCRSWGCGSLCATGTRRTHERTPAHSYSVYITQAQSHAHTPTHTHTHQYKQLHTHVEVKYRTTPTNHSTMRTSTRSTWTVHLHLSRTNTLNLSSSSWKPRMLMHERRTCLPESGRTTLWFWGPGFLMAICMFPALMSFLSPPSDCAVFTTNLSEDSHLWCCAATFSSFGL